MKVDGFNVRNISLSKLQSACVRVLCVHLYENSLAKKERERGCSLHCVVGAAMNAACCQFIVTRLNIFPIFRNIYSRNTSSNMLYYMNTKREYPTISPS